MASTNTPPPPTFTFTSDASLKEYTVSLKTYLDAHPEFDCIATGALVFHTDPVLGDQILIQKRAAHDSMPGRWETPGGACDPEDESILHGAARELWEESGLVAEHVIALVGGEHIFFTRRNQRVSKFNFEVRVRTEGDGVAPTVTVDENEHSAFLWATEEECRAGRKGEVVLTFTTQRQEKAILEGFELRKARNAGP
jgi:8-oxo-dGTP pyrophosphatase MutT (NUDIX family)